MLGGRVKVIEQSPDMLDMVFAADCGIAYQNKIVLSNFKYPQRQRERSIYRKTYNDENKTPILTLDTKGHTARIDDIIITKDKKIITASNDKTIRVWNQNGTEERKILGQKSISGRLYNIINKLREDNLIEWTLPDTPKSSKQKYKITAKGIIFTKLIDKGKEQ